MNSRAINRFRILFLVPVISMIWTSCSNTKDNLINRTAHNLSAHYNGYYNAGIKLEEALAKLAEAHEDHYDRPLHVFPYGDHTKAKTVFPQLEDVMKRTSTVISRHTMYDKRGNEKPESEKWIDDNWLLYGKAQFFKRDFFEAIETFTYVEATYKKEPTRHLASMWLAKTYLELTEIREAENKLDFLRNQSDFPRKNKWELDAVYADFYLQTKSNERAIPHLQRASVSAPAREMKIRLKFILAQLYQQKGEFKRAFDLYTKIVKMNPKYEMAFNARLNRARCYDSSSGSSESVYKELRKMQKDPKNKDFMDQIYYALAGLSKNEGKDADEIDYLNKSIRASTNNQNQKALSYLELARINYKKPEYRIAQAYYDSTVTILSKDYPDYPEIVNLRNSLTKLVKYMKTIETEDSLQRMSTMSVEERTRIIDTYLAEEEKKNQQIKAESTEEPSNQIFGTPNQAGANAFNNASGSNWYFYNPQAISFGFNEFAKKFGNRKLEDNWRRSKKETAISDEVEIVIEEAENRTPGDTSVVADNLSTRDNMLNSVPEGDEALDKSHAKIIDAFYNIGMLYREQLSDMNASVGAFEELLKRYPVNKYQLQSYYQLYRTYLALGNTSRSDYYKNIILNDHGDTEYAEIIRNPNYGVESAKRKSHLDLFYEETYRKYLNGEYAAVISRKAQSDVQFPQNPYTAKFDMLKTLAIGRTQPLQVFEASLNDIIRNHSADSVKDIAQEILDLINSGEASIDTSMEINPLSIDTIAANKKLFKYIPDTLHNAILIFQNIGGPLDPERLKNKIADFNQVNFGSKGITMQELLFDHRLKIMILKSFNNKQDALQYYSLLYDNDDVFGQVNPDAYQLYVISVNNLPTILREKKTNEYEDFYRGFYR